MNNSIKTAEEIEKMRIAGKLAAEVLTMIEPYVVAGVSTEHLNQLCHQYIINVQQAIPAPLNYRGFPKSICTSINEVVCHGIPSTKRKLKPGDIINIDVTVKKDGYHGDTSKMFMVGKTSKLAERLVSVTRESLYRSIAVVKPGATLNDIAAQIQPFAEQQGFSVVRNYCGHGIGKNFHESPEVMHYVCPKNNFVLQEGMTFTIEPMINQGTFKTLLKKDNWTVITKDKKLSAQWEHTILVTSTGYEVLTKREEEQNLF